MIHPHLKTPQNTTISAIIALERFPVGQKEFRIQVAQKELDEQRSMPVQEFMELLELNRTAHERRVLRAVVYDNPYANRPLPIDIFVGPFDERWGPSGGSIGQTFIGAQLEALKTREHILELDISPFMKALRKKDI